MTESSRPKIEHGAKLLNVPQYVSVTQHDSFRFTGGAAGEEKYRLFPISRFGETEKITQQPGRCDRGNQAPKDNFRFQLRHELFQSEDIFRPREIFQTLHDRFGGNRMQDLTPVDSRLQGGASSGEIQIDRYFVRQGYRDVRHHGASARRQHDRHAFARDNVS